MESKVRSITQLQPSNDYVYDLEVDELNNFFANNILVHNSAIFLCSPLVEEFCKKADKTLKSLTRTDVKAIIAEIDKFIANEVNTECQRVIKEKCYSEEPERIEFKREAFSMVCAAFAKKNYFLHIIDKEGIATDEFKYTGIEIKKNELPPRVKKLIQEIYEDSCRKHWTEFEYNTRLREIWTMFKELDFNEIAYFKGYHTARDSGGFLQMNTGTTQTGKASTYYNQLIEKFDLTGKYDLIRVGDKIRICYVNPNRFGIEVIGFLNEFPTEFREYFSIDHITLFKKMILKPLNVFCSIRKWKQFNPCSEAMQNIFEF